MENSVLYRKYRSKNFKEILGQQIVVDSLVYSIINNRTSHAYLFAGPRGTGKTSLARLMAKALNCSNFTSLQDVCNECENCNLINNNQAIDIIEMDAASNRGIEEIRQLRDNISYMPSVLRKKIYIIDEVHMLTTEAFNALLKTLEEPPSHVIFLFATTEPHKLPITILSRVQRFDLSLAKEEEIKRKLFFISKEEGLEIGEDALGLIYRKSGGSFRDAESLLGKIISLNSTSVLLKDVYRVLGIISEVEIENLSMALIKKDTEQALEKLRILISQGYSATQIVDQLLENLKEKLIIEDQNIDLLKIATLIIEAKKDLKEFEDKDTILELEVIKLCQSGGLGKPKGVINESKVIKEDKQEEKPIRVESPEALESHSKRLKVILTYSHKEIIGNTLTIYSNNSFEKNFILKKENMDILKKAYQERGIYNIIVEDKKEVEEEVSILKKVESKDIENATSEDNSELVESILLN